MSPAVSLKPNPVRRDDEFAHVLAAQIRNESTESPLNAVFCADIDMISDWFFFERNRGNLDIEFDNVAFVLNAVDQLAGDATFIDLRSRRASLRTLKYVENETRGLREKLGKEEKEAQETMKTRLDESRKELQAEVDETNFSLTIATTRGPAQRAKDVGRRLDRTSLREILGAWSPMPRHVYVCGSNAFVEATTNALLDEAIPAARIRTERYGGAG